MDPLTPLKPRCEYEWRVRILVAEDERDLADLVAVGLRRHAMAVDVVYDGAATVERLDMRRSDLLPDRWSP
ncbi:hypothetical protein GCM10009850_102820 [Nonomuraea monospora]|uniref:Response regulatory domain-containing protein n=1 Tax=Nonomuraea monospora TaxID=568818 RepID=A0ABN3CZA8_9ACTN